MKPLLSAVFEELRHKNKIRTQSEFGDKMGYNKGYISELMKSTQPLPNRFRDKLNKVFGVSILYMASNGKEGEMFE